MLANSLRSDSAVTRAAKARALANLGKLRAFSTCENLYLPTFCSIKKAVNLDDEGEDAEMEVN